MPEPETNLPKPEENQKPQGSKQQIKVLWDSILEFFNLTKIGNHLLGEARIAVTKALILFLLCLGVIALLISKGCDKSAQIVRLDNDKDGLRKDKEFLQQSLTITAQSNSVLLANYQFQAQILNQKIQDDEQRISRLIQERDKAQIEAQNAQNA
ncbi:MAG TPA: hypothetical protein VF437_10865, partial [Verrucomicrobiae bacterium]